MYRSIALALMLSVVTAAQADDVDNVGELSGNEFRGLSEDLGAALSYKGLLPAKPMGTIGFDMALDVSNTRVRNELAWRTASGGEDVATLTLARVRVTKGLPFGFDVGGFYSTAAGSNISAYGAELRYALVEGGVAAPAIGLRGAVTRLNGVNDLSFDTRSVDISISKSFGPMTPYAGVGQVWVDSEYTGPALVCIPEVQQVRCTGAAESFNDMKYFAGVRFSAVVLNLVLEADRTGDAATYAVKLGFGF